MSKKLTYEYVKSKFEEAGWELLSTEYVNNVTKMKCVCPIGHITSKTWASLKQDQGCYYCNDKYTFEEVFKIFEDKGLTPLFTEYVNNRTPLQYRCRNNHLHQIRLDDLLKGRGCIYCSNNYIKSYAYVKSAFKAKKYKLLTSEKEYNNSKSVLKVRCPKKHIYTTTYNAFQQGFGCKKCQYIALSSKLKKSTEDVKKELSYYGCTLISSYINIKTKLTYKCTLGHLNTKSLEEFRRRKHKCTTCYIINNRGAQHPLYLNGNSITDYCPIWHDKEYKTAIKRRDNYICQNPYCFNTTKRLSIHHIDYDKKNCHPGNLITVCISCNGRANKDRNWHTRWYQTLMEKKFNYKYE